MRETMKSGNCRGPALARILLFLILNLLVITGCSINPVTGNKELVLISTEREIATGEEHYLLLQQAKGGLYTVDPSLTEYVTYVGQRIAALSDRDLPYEFVVINDSTPNAWTLPGGKVAVNRGLLVELDNEAELAAVLGHEIAHAAARHGARAIQINMLLEVALSGIALASRNYEYSNYIIGGASVAFQLADRKYSRDAERVSDYHGMKYMHAAGYDTTAAVTLQEKFVALAQDRNPNWLNGLFASHPPSTERVENNRATLAEFLATGALERTRYQRQLTYLRTRQGAYEEADWARQQLSKTPRLALQAIDNAIGREPLEPLFYGIKGDILAHQGHYDKAIREYGMAIELAPHYYEYFLDRGLAFNSLGQRSRARVDLEYSNNLLPTALASYTLGGIALTDGDRMQAKRLFKQASTAGGEIGSAAQESFVRLDIVDTPARYVSAEPFFEDGQIVLEVKNSTEYELNNILVRINVEINDDSTYRRLPLSRLTPYATKVVESGIRYGEEDAVEVEVRVLQAEPAP